MLGYSATAVVRPITSPELVKAFFLNANILWGVADDKGVIFGPTSRVIRNLQQAVVDELRRGLGSEDDIEFDAQPDTGLSRLRFRTSGVPTKRNEVASM